MLTGVLKAQLLSSTVVVCELQCWLFPPWESLLKALLAFGSSPIQVSLQGEGPQEGLADFLFPLVFEHSC